MTRCNIVQILATVGRDVDATRANPQHSMPFLVADLLGLGARGKELLVAGRRSKHPELSPCKSSASRKDSSRTKSRDGNRGHEDARG